MLCVRITYLGELGYELYVPAEQAVHVYDRIVEAGEQFGLRHAGLKALASLRMEKGYRDYGHDIDNTDTVLEAGLGFAVALDKPGGFIGRDAVAAARKPTGPPTRRLVQVLVADPEPLMFHAEIVRRDGVPSATCAPPRTATRSAAPSAWRWSRPANRSPRHTSTPACGPSRSTAASIRRGHRRRRCTTRPTNASGADHVAND